MERPLFYLEQTGFKVNLKAIEEFGNCELGVGWERYSFSMDIGVSSGIYEGK
jgi:hypothetical protein